MPVNPVAKLINFGQFPFKISTQKFKYLGIWITHAFKDIFKANFLPLLHNLKEDLEHWNLLPLSLGGRINTIKMNVLPKFLYVFQCVPIFLSKSFFVSIDKLISGFIWNKKNPRIRKGMLQRLRQHGGLSLPNFQFYYWAANIKAMLYWKESSANDKWLQLENSSCCHTSLYSLLCTRLPLLDPISKYSSNPIVKHSFRIWIQFRRFFSLKDLSLCAPIVRNHLFAPSTTDKAFYEWVKRGITTIEDLFIDNTFISFDQLMLKFNIPRLHFLHSYRSVILCWHRLLILHHSSLLDSILRLNPYSKGVIGTVYSLLISCNLEPLTSLKKKWEEDLEVELSDEVWSKARDRVHSSSVCLRHTVIQFKVVHRLHWSKVKLAKFTPNIDPTCDRCMQASATLSHMFWSCPKLNGFWQSIFKAFSDVLKIPLEPSAVCCNIWSNSTRYTP